MTTDQQQPNTNDVVVYLGVGEGGSPVGLGPLFDAGRNSRQPEVDSLRAQLADLQAKEASMLEHQRYVGGVYADLVKAHEALEVQVAHMQRQDAETFEASVRQMDKVEAQLADMQRQRDDWRTRFGKVTLTHCGTQCVCVAELRAERDEARAEVERLKADQAPVAVWALEALAEGRIITKLIPPSECRDGPRYAGFYCQDYVEPKATIRGE